MAGKGATPATRALGTAGIAYRLHSYAFAPGADGIGRQAAATLGVDPARLLKTLVIEVEGLGLALVVLAVDRSLDLKAAAGAFGARRSELAATAAAERATGYVKGGISPIGTRRRLPAVVDTAACDQESILVNGGRRGLQIELAPADLVAVIEAGTAAVARR